jgi:hypothetical protein
MTPDEVNLAIAWAASEGWNPGLYPTFRRLKQGQGSFLVRINKFELFVNKDKSG